MRVRQPSKLRGAVESEGSLTLGGIVESGTCGIRLGPIPAIRSASDEFGLRFWLRTTKVQRRNPLITIEGNPLL